MFGRVTIRLGIGPHSSYDCIADGRVNMSTKLLGVCGCQSRLIKVASGFRFAVFRALFPQM